MNSAGCGHVSLPEATLQSRYEFFQVNSLFVRKAVLAQNMVRIRILPVMSGTERDC